MNKRIQQYGVAIFATMAAVGVAVFVPNESAFVSDGKLSLKVIHRQDPVSNVEIALIRKSDGKIEKLKTDNFGYARVMGPKKRSFIGGKIISRPSGTYSFTVHKSGYVPKKQQFFLPEDETIEKTVFLKKPKVQIEATADTVKADAWQEKALMKVSKQNMGISSFKGDIFSMGGWHKIYLNSVERYSMQHDSWQKVAPMLIKRDHHTSSIIGERIFVLGGHNKENYYGLWETEIYYPKEDIWKFGPKIPQLRHSHSANVIGKLIYLFGGKGASNSIGILDTRDMTWQRGREMPTRRYYHTSHAVGSKIYLIGGRYNRRTLASVEEYDTIKNRWAAKSPLPNPRYAHTGCVNTHNIYVFGGKGGENIVEVYNTKNDTWKRLSNMDHARINASCIAAQNKLFVLGGAGGLNLNLQYTPSNDSPFLEE